ncbi:MAG: Gfo/Idh/MocA family oxidoreductase, partial [Mesorhizobium sp.]|nr:Gfo/Idh/MocA family oxidoreductase [Mesorhizobium sp.]
QAPAAGRAAPGPASSPRRRRARPARASRPWPRSRAGDRRRRRALRARPSSAGSGWRVAISPARHRRRRRSRRTGHACGHGRHRRRCHRRRHARTPPRRACGRSRSPSTSWRGPPSREVALCQRAQRKRRKDDRSLDEEELGIAHLQAGKTVVQDRQEQDADRCVAQPAGAAPEGRAAQDDGNDGIEFQPEARRWRGRAETAEHDQHARRREAAHHHQDHQPQPAFADVATRLDRARPDLLLVLAADPAHVQIADAAIARGIACLIEKPLARDFREAAALVGRAAQAGVLLASVANKRFSPPYAMAKALVDGGALKAAPTVFTGKFTLGYPYVDLLEGGTVHLLDLVQWFMGPVTRLHARGVHWDDGQPRSVVISFAFASGAIGTLMTSAAGMSFKPWERVEIVGRNAFLIVDDQVETTLYDDETGPAKSWRPAVPNTLMFDEAFGGYAGLLENTLDAVRGVAPLAVPARDGAAAVGLIEAIRRSIAEDRDIDIAAEGLAP